MKLQQLLKVMHFAERMKDTTRHSFTSQGRQESVAEHSWRLALLSYFVKDEFPEADIHKVLLMCLFHDLGEAFGGDIPSFDKKTEDENRELDMLSDWMHALPEPYCGELTQLLREMRDNSTVEARIVHALDGLEVLLQHNEADIGTWNAIEYDLLPKYANERVEFSEYLSAFRAAVRADTLKKIEEHP